MRAAICLTLLACDPIVLDADPSVDGARVVDAAPDAAPTSACVEATGAVDFGAIPRGQQADADIVLTGCRDRDVAITSVTIDVAGADPGFRLANSGPLAGLLQPRTPGDPVARAVIRVEFKPTNAGRAYTATVRIQTSDPRRPRIDVPLHGAADWRGVPCEPWLAEAQGAERTVAPGDVITLTATPPAGLAAEAAETRWRVTQRPAGSRSNPVERYADPDDPAIGGPVDDQHTPTAQFFVDLPGVYAFEVRSGLPAAAGCADQTARLRIVACPCPGDLHVQLRWRVDPSDPPPVGIRSNLDLHLAHPEALAWNDPVLDCRSINPTPDWGVARLGLDDPLLDSDYADAPGVENIFLERMERPDAISGSYRIGVEHVRAEWTARADVEVRIGGELVWSAIDRPLTPADGWWDVAAIGWQDGALTLAPLDRTFSTRPPLDATLPPGAACLPNGAPPCSPNTDCEGAAAGQAGVCQLVED